MNDLTQVKQHLLRGPDLGHADLRRDDRGPRPGQLPQGRADARSPAGSGSATSADPAAGLLGRGGDGGTELHGRLDRLGDDGADVFDVHRPSRRGHSGVGVTSTFHEVSLSSGSFRHVSTSQRFPLMTLR